MEKTILTLNVPQKLGSRRRSIKNCHVFKDSYGYLIFFSLDLNHNVATCKYCKYYAVV